jgi:hypothetical protein
VGLPRNPRAPWPKPKNGPPPILGGLLEAPVVSPWRSHQFPTWSPLSCRCLQDGYSIWVCRQCSFCLPCPASSDSLSLPRYFVRTTTVTARKKGTVDELNAHAKGNGHQRGVHREKDNLRDLNKHVDRVKWDQNTALDRHVL